MTSALAVTDQIKTLNDLHQTFSLHQTEDDNFFTEWLDPLPDLNEAEIMGLDRLRQRYLYHRADGLLLEGTVNYIVITPLLDLAGFLDPPFKLRSPESVSIEIEDPAAILKGLIDVLIIRDDLWILVIESKRNSIPVTAALPQILAYMMTAPESSDVIYGLATNGDTFIFIKLDRTSLQYDLSDSFTLLPKRHKFQDVLRILKRLG